MKKSVLFLSVMFFSALNSAVEDPRKTITVEEAAGKSGSEFSETNDSKFAKTGNLFQVNWGMIYRIDRLPAYSIGMGMTFPLSKRLFINSGISLLNAKVSSDEEFEGSTEVISGSITYSNVEINFNYLVTPTFWIGAGAVYESMIDGYYVDRIGTNNIHSDLSRDEEQSRLSGKLSFGLLSPIGKEVFAIPSVNFRYNIPMDHKFEKKNIYIGVNFGLGIRLGGEN